MLRACAADAGTPWLTMRTSGPVAAMYSAFSDSSASAVPVRVCVCACVCVCLCVCVCVCVCVQAVK
jgi:hypothetical protein